MWFLADSLVFAFQCTPVRKAWEIEIPGHCINPLITIQVVQTFNVALDAVILALPISGVLRLQMSTSRKFSVMIMFLLGGLWVFLTIFPLHVNRVELALLTFWYSRAVVIALIRLIILFTENLEDVTCKSQCFNSAQRSSNTKYR